MSTEQKSLEDQIKDAEAREHDLCEELNAVRKDIEKLKQALAYRNYNVTVGSIVFVGKDVFKVVEIRPCYFGKKPWCKGNPKRKDGTFGTAIRNLCADWELSPEDTK